MRLELDFGDVNAAAWLQPTLDALTAANLEWLRTHPDAPSIYTAGVRYRREPMGSEKWRALPVVLSTRFGDCEDLGCARAAELLARGLEARAVPIFVDRWSVAGRRTNLIHIVVQLPDGIEEDPSRRLGMNGPA